MLCARRTVLLHARRHHSFSSSDIRSDVARAEDLVEECRNRVKEAEADEKAAVRDLRDVLRHSESEFNARLRSTASHREAHGHSTRAEHRVAEETRRAVEAEMEPMRHRLSKMSRSLDKLLHKTERKQWYREREFRRGEHDVYRGDDSCHRRGRGCHGRPSFRKFVAFMLVAGLLYAYFNADEDRRGKRCSDPDCPFPREGPLFREGLSNAITGKPL